MSNYQIDDVRRVARMFQALSNPNRLRIFLKLVACCGVGTRWSSEDGICPCVGDLGKDLRIAPSTVSHHMRELHQAGLIGMERRGKNVDCWVPPEVLERMTEFFEQPGERCADLAQLCAPPDGEG